MEYKKIELDKKTKFIMKKFAVVGRPISHSLSPKIHHEFAKQCNIKISYEAVEIEEDFESTIKEMFASGYDGINVTIPFKEKAFQLADQIYSKYKTLGAVNTLWQKNRKIFADSTDGLGFINDLKNNSISIKDSTLLIVGAGGSARSILPSIIEKEPKQVVIINRTLAKAEALTGLFDQSKVTVSISSLTDIIRTKITGVINTSSAGLLGEKIILPEGVFESAQWVYDLSYSKQITTFNSLAREGGIEAYFDGLGMLVFQAAASFEIWTGMKPNAEKTLSYLKGALN